MSVNFGFTYFFVAHWNVIAWFSCVLLFFFILTSPTHQMDLHISYPFLVREHNFFITCMDLRVLPKMVVAIQLISSLKEEE